MMSNGVASARATQVELWTMRKGDRELVCYLPNGGDLRVHEAGDMRLS